MPKCLEECSASDAARGRLPVPADIKAIVAKCLRANPDERPTSRQLIDDDFGPESKAFGEAAPATVPEVPAPAGVGASLAILPPPASVTATPQQSPGTATVATSMSGATITPSTFSPTHANSGRGVHVSLPLTMPGVLSHGNSGGVSASAPLPVASVISSTLTTPSVSPETRASSNKPVSMVQQVNDSEILSDSDQPHVNVRSASAQQATSKPTRPPPELPPKPTLLRGIEMQEITIKSHDLLVSMNLYHEPDAPSPDIPSDSDGSHTGSVENLWKKNVKFSIERRDSHPADKLSTVCAMTA